MSNSLVLLPGPRRLEMLKGAFRLADQRLILLESVNPQALRFAARRFQQSLHRFGLTWEVLASKTIPQDQIGLVLRIAPENVTHPQGYELDVTPNKILIEAHDEAGVFYGICSLIQILESFVPHSTLPALRITDWPDFPVRGVMLDVSRDKVPTLDTLLALVDMLAGWKINQLQLYTEHTFAYRNHPEVWANASPFTGQDILELDAYCRQRYIELVPNQNSFGHMHRWLTHPRYAPLAEVTEGYMTPWGEHKDGPFSLCPGDPGSLELVRSLYDELLPHFSSRMFNVNCDETFDLGQGRTKDDCERRGAGRVYLDYLLKLHKQVTARGKTMQFWGDMIVQHPDLIPELPKDSIALEWGYEADHPFDEHGAHFAAAGLSFYVCPGTSSWCSIAGRTENALGNLLNAAENGRMHGATGYLITDWGDDGHWQVLPVSFLGLAMGAAYSWALDANRDMDVPRAVSLHAFRDPTGVMGRVAYDLGNVYRAVGLELPNASALFWILQQPLPQVRAALGVPPAALRRTLKVIDRAMRGLEKARMDRPDAALIVQEHELTARLLRHACRRGLLALEHNPAKVTVLCRALDRDMRQIIHDYTRAWLKRNRPGGLTDSVARLEKARADYRRI